jgi:isopenicillin N synthase-like dioxygenase
LAKITCQVPVIDLSATNEEVAKALDHAFTEMGFAVLAGHGIPTGVIAAAREAVVKYFEQPLDRKLPDRITRDNYRGYIPLGFFSPNSAGQSPDRYEGYKLHFEVDANDPICKACDLYGPNKWPAEQPAMRDAILNYWRACDDLTTRLLTILAGILNIDASRLLDPFDESLTNMTLLHYPPQDANESGVGIHAHKDTDALTLLAPDPIGGLLIRPRDRREWIEIDAPENSIIVNIGDLLELWSGGYFVSTPHKVINRSGRARFSFPYFAVPRFDAVVSPLVPVCAGFNRAEVPVGEVSREVWRTNWSDTTPGTQGYDLGTLSD